MNRHTNILTLTLIAASIALTGCGKKEAEARAAAAEAKLVQMNEISAAKDSLTKELVATTSLINEINTEIGKVKPSKGQKTVVQGEKVISLDEYHGNLLDRIKDLTARLDDNETKLAAAQARLRILAGRDKDMVAQIAAYDSMVAEYKLIVESQRLQIADLTTQVETLTAEKTQLTQEKVQLVAQVTDMTNFANRVYVILGTKKDLIAKGVVKEVGGSRVLGIGPKAGKTLVPNSPLDEAVFAAMSKDKEFEIALPNPEKKYKLVSPQNVTALDTKPEKDGSFRGSALKIADPAAFWAPSKYLILVEG